MNKVSALLISTILLLSCNEELNENTDDIICCENNELPNVTLSVDEPIISEGSGVATISVSIDKVPNLGDVNILLEISGTADSSDFILSTDILSFISDTINEITLTAVQDMEVEEDETIVIDIKSVSNGQESGEQQLIITIVDDDEYQMHKDSLPYPDEYFDEFLVGLDITDSERELFIKNANRFIEICIGQNFFVQNSNPLRAYKNPLADIHETNSYPIYFHFEEYIGKITSQVIDRIRDDYEILLDNWLEGLKSYDTTFSQELTKVKIFGFVFNENVELDQSFYDKYGDYPIVTGYNKTNEESPWEIRTRSNNELFNHNWYVVEDFRSLKVVGNRTDLGSSVNFSPSDWSNYEHPEGLDYFQTKWWYRLGSAAFAQRQYLQMGGCITNHETGETILSIYLHEMGHCLFLDDIYDRGKYPDGDGVISVMNSGQNPPDYKISEFDKMTLRMVWKHQTIY